MHKVRLYKVVIRTPYIIISDTGERSTILNPTEV